MFQTPTPRFGGVMLDGRYSFAGKLPLYNN